MKNEGGKKAPLSKSVFIKFHVISDDLISSDSSMSVTDRYQLLVMLLGT